MDATLSKTCAHCHAVFYPRPGDYPKLFNAKRFCGRRCGVLSRSYDLPTRLWARVAVAGPDDCWLWQGAVIRNGYGVIGRGGGRHVGNVLVHVAAYLDRVGPIPDGYQIDHLCRVTACCNPAHLEAVTQQENLRRQAAAVKAARTTCRKGLHAWPEHVGVTPDGNRYCRACNREGGRKRYLARKAAAARKV